MALPHGGRLDLDQLLGKGQAGDAEQGAGGPAAGGLQAARDHVPVLEQEVDVGGVVVQTDHGKETPAPQRGVVATPKTCKITSFWPFISRNRGRTTTRTGEALTPVIHGL